LLSSKGNVCGAFGLKMKTMASRSGSFAPVCEELGGWPAIKVSRGKGRRKRFGCSEFLSKNGKNPDAVSDQTRINLNNVARSANKVRMSALNKPS